MKKIIYLGTALAFVGSLSLTAGVSAATRHDAPAAAKVNVRLCSSAPVGVGGDAHIVQGMWKGMAIANSQWRVKFRALGMNILPSLTMNDANAAGTKYDVGVEAVNAHQCLDNPADMAYIGTLNSGAAQASEPVLDRGGMAMISPANSNPVLTSPVPAARKTYEPLFFNHTFKHPTYYRVVTTDALQGPAGALYIATALHLKKFYLVDDQQTYGAGLAAKLSAFAKSHLHMTEIGSGHLDTSSTAATTTSAAAIARAIVAAKPPIVYCGCDEPYSGPMLAAARRAGYTGFYAGGDAINDVSFGKFAGGNANLYKTYSTFVGDPHAVPPAFKNVEKRFYPTWTPGPYDSEAYDASNVALNAIYQSKLHGTFKGTAFQRRASLLKYIAAGNYKGTTGNFHFDKNGDTSLLIISVWKWAGSSWSWIKTYITPKTKPLLGLAPTP